MSLTRFADRTPEKSGKGISGFDCRCLRTRLICAARTIHFTRSYPSKTNPRPFFTPNWTISIPHANRRAGKDSAGRDYPDGRQENKGQHYRAETMFQSEHKPFWWTERVKAGHRRGLASRLR